MPRKVRLLSEDAEPQFSDSVWKETDMRAVMRFVLPTCLVAVVGAMTGIVSGEGPAGATSQRTCSSSWSVVPAPGEGVLLGVSAVLLTRSGRLGTRILEISR